MDRSRIYMSTPNGQIHIIKFTIIIVQEKYYTKANIWTWYRNLKYGLIDATPEFKIWSKNVARSIHISFSDQPWYAINLSRYISPRRCYIWSLELRLYLQECYFCTRSITTSVDLWPATSSELSHPGIQGITTIKMLVRWLIA